MICFEIWWNSADADAFRAKHEEHDGAEFKPVWDAAVRAMLDAAPAAPAVAPAQDAFDVALTALDRYQHNWDTGLPGEYAQPERIHMECAVEAVREALTEARDAAPAQAEQQGEPESSCDPADICAGCQCKYNTYGQAEQKGEGWERSWSKTRILLATALWAFGRSPDDERTPEGALRAVDSVTDAGSPLAWLRYAQPSARVALSDQQILDVFSKFTMYLDTPWQKVQVGRAILAASAAQTGNRNEH